MPPRHVFPSRTTRAAATELGVEAAAIHAVADVEAGGKTGFDPQGRSKILFEGHLFSKLTGGTYDFTYPWLSKGYPKDNEYYKWEQWSRLYEAMDVDIEAALKAGSWGMLQVLGPNHNGWGTVVTFVAAMFVSEYMHLKAFAAFCKDNHLVGHLKARRLQKDTTGRGMRRIITLLECRPLS